MRIFKFMLFVSKVRNKISTLKQDEERANKFKRYAVCSIILSVFAVAFGFLTAIVLPLTFKAEGLFATILLVMALAVCIIATLLFLLYSLIYLVGQLKINKKPLSWVSLAVFFAAIAAIIVIVILLL